MAPFRLTAQHSESWREQCEKEQRALTVARTQEALDEIQQQPASTGSKAHSLAGSVNQSSISVASVSEISHVSSRVSEGRGRRSAAQKLELLQKKLDEEKQRRKELEVLLKRVTVAE